MLFSDIEGSTLLLTRLGPEYADVLDGQRRIMRKAWSDHDGTEMGTEGDSFFVVFDAAENAVAAAAQAQRDLAGQVWPRSEELRVRMGIHVGSPIVHDGGYVGIDVHRAARIAGVAHGGQVVVSAPTRALVQYHLDSTLALLDLGEHQLKDLPEPERIFQLRIPGLQTDFPPLKSLGASSSLPRPAGRLVGRDGDLDSLAALLAIDAGPSDERVRVVTLTGPGGSGKTRLAIALAHRLVELPGRFPDGAFFVRLTEVTSQETMWATIGEVLDIPAGSRTRNQLIEHLRSRSLLLALDNLEQIPDAAAVVADLHEYVPGAVVVATSRGPLHLAAEHLYDVLPLAVCPGDDPVEISECAAVELFAQAATKIRPGFRVTQENAADLATICRHLDGLPLALELAAARTKFLSPHAIADRMDQALDLTGHNHQAPHRQQTLRDTIDWSYQLLNDEQRLLFRRLGVFSGGADLAAIHAVAPDLPRDVLDVLGELVDASLVRVSDTDGGEPRFWLLETIHAFALDTLEQVRELDDVRGLHATHFAEVAETLEPLMLGPRFIEAYSQFTLEHDNLRAALDWASETVPPEREEPADLPAVTGLRIIYAMRRFSRTGGHVAEERPWVERLLDVTRHHDNPLVAQCLCMLAYHYMTTDHSRCREVIGDSIAMSRRLGDPRQLIQALITLAEMELEDERLNEVTPLVQEAKRLARDIDDPRVAHDVDMLVVQLEVLRGNYERALQVLEDSYAVTKQDSSPIDRISSDHERAWILRRMGRTDEALVWIRAATEVAVSLGFAWRNGLTFMAEDYAALLADLGDAPGAVRLLGAVDARREALDLPRSPSVDRDLADSLNKARAALPLQDWERHYGAGRARQLEDALVTAESWQEMAT